MLNNAVVMEMEELFGVAALAAAHVEPGGVVREAERVALDAMVTGDSPALEGERKSEE